MGKIVIFNPSVLNILVLLTMYILPVYVHVHAQRVSNGTFVDVQN